MGEAYYLFLPAFVGFMTDNASDAPYALAVLVTYKRFFFCLWQTAVLLGVKEVTNIGIHVRHILATTLVQRSWQLHKIVHHLFVVSLFYFYTHAYVSDFIMQR